MKNSYFAELTLHLRREGLTVLPPEDGLLPVDLDGRRLCRITPSGGVRYQETDIAGEVRGAALDRVVEIAGSTAEYMRLMDAAPQLLADGLEGDYRLLTEFNGAILAGHPTRYGVEFVTWERDRGGGLCCGHYFSFQDYACAKQDFAVRAGLIPESALIPEQKETDASEQGGMHFC